MYVLLSIIILIIIVRLYLILFYIERGLHSRTETGEREINGSAVHSIDAVCRPINIKYKNKGVKEWSIPTLF
jgi:hypothetical protein